MNTMADGASERLVAQIGEALFGQPGLTLMELAEKVKGVSGCHGNVLSAQPTPAGQVLDREQDARFEVVRNGDTEEARISALADWLDQCDYRYDVMSVAAATLRDLSARQPVGQEPVSKSVGIDALVQLLADDAEECAKGWVERGDAYASGKSAGLLAAADYFRKIATSQRWSEFLSSPAQAVDLDPRPMDTAPRDGTMVRLLVEFDENATEDAAGPAWTIGACNDDNVGEDGPSGWQFAGWCWTHDHFTEGSGTPVGWLPLIDSKAVGK